MWGLCWCPLVIEFWIFGLRPSSLWLGLGLRLGFGAGSCWVRALLDVLCCFRPAVIRGVFGNGSAFRVGWTTAVGGGGFNFWFSVVFCWGWRGGHFGGGLGAGLSLCGSMWFGDFPDFSQFPKILRLKSLGNSSGKLHIPCV